MNLLFSVYKTRIWMFGKDGVCFAIGPLRFTTLAYLDATGGLDTRIPPVIERVVDYEYFPSLHQDRFILHLEDGKSVERKFGRSICSVFNKTSNRYDAQESEASPPAVAFQKKLEERCGY